MLKRRILFSESILNIMIVNLMTCSIFTDSLIGLRGGFAGLDFIFIKALSKSTECILLTNSCRLLTNSATLFYF